MEGARAAGQLARGAPLAPSWPSRARRGLASSGLDGNAGRVARGKPGTRRSRAGGIRRPTSRWRSQTNARSSRSGLRLSRPTRGRDDHEQDDELHELTIGFRLADLEPHDVIRSAARLTARITTSEMIHYADLMPPLSSYDAARMEQAQADWWYDMRPCTRKRPPRRSFDHVAMTPDPASKTRNVLAVSNARPCSRDVPGSSSPSVDAERSVRHGQTLASSGLAVLGSRSCSCCCRRPYRERRGHESGCRPGRPCWALDTHRPQPTGSGQELRASLPASSGLNDGGQGERKRHGDRSPRSSRRFQAAACRSVAFLSATQKGFYRWKVASRKLTFTKLKDTCAAEVVIHQRLDKAVVRIIRSVDRHASHDTPGAGHVETCFHGCSHLRGKTRFAGVSESGRGATSMRERSRLDDG